MSFLLQIELLAQVLLISLLSGLVGMDRERRDKSAGLRTHMLAGIGSCVFTALGLHAFPSADLSRVAAAVVTGIGFLGAGAIYQSEDAVRELTTAASIWATAAIGIAVGVGAWLLATGVTVTVWIILAVLRKLEDKSSNANSV